MEKYKHSVFGLASCMISTLVLTMLYFIVFFISHGLIEDNTTESISIGALIIMLVPITLISLGLSIAGLFQKNRKKLFIILGIILSVLTFLLVIAPMIRAVMY